MNPDFFLAFTTKMAKKTAIFVESSIEQDFGEHERSRSLFKERLSFKILLWNSYVGISQNFHSFLEGFNSNILP